MSTRLDLDLFQAEPDLPVEGASPHSHDVHEIALPTLIALAVAAFLAGAVDAIGGGGGLIMVPALLAVGLPPHLALGTNKGQLVFGSFSAMVRFARGVMVEGRRARITFPAAFLGTLAGAPDRCRGSGHGRAPPSGRGWGDPAAPRRIPRGSDRADGRLVRRLLRSRGRDLLHRGVR